jgi:hypothetical protein
MYFSSHMLSHGVIMWFRTEDIKVASKKVLLKCLVRCIKLITTDNLIIALRTKTTDEIS